LKQVKGVSTSLRVQILFMTVMTGRAVTELVGLEKVLEAQDAARERAGLAGSILRRVSGQVISTLTKKE
jgi:hypothetical protein